MEIESISTGRVYDISNCDREPIHIPGAIQPHGFLFAVSEPAFTIQQISQNLEGFLGHSAEKILGTTLEQYLSAESMDAMRAALTRPDLRSANPIPLRFAHEAAPYTGVIHRHRDVLLLEVEPARGGDAAERLDRYSSTRAAISELRNAGTLGELCRVACAQVQALTGFERVVLYYFDRDWNGAVIAEAKTPEAESFLGLHFPASDIPRQARELYTLNWLRLIPDVEYRPSPLVPAVNPRTGEPLDLSFSVLRSVSPIHVEYLKNMGLRASMSISLMKGKQLWGLISCAGLGGPKYIPFETRAACEFIGEVVSSLLAEKSLLENADAKLHTRAVQGRLVSAIARGEDLVRAIQEEEESLLSLVRANGAALSYRGNLCLLGRTPPAEKVRELIAWLDSRNTDGSYYTDCLLRDYGPSLDPEFSGLLAIRLAKSSAGQYLLWFRPEVAQTLSWGGNPNKATTGEEGLRLHPRKSFAAWQEVVRNKSLQWRDDEREAAAELQRTFNDLVLTRAERLEKLIDELRRSNFELDSFAHAASHDLKEPVRGIHNYADFLLREPGLSEKGRTRLQTIYRLTERMDGLLNSLLDYSQVGRTELSLTQLPVEELVHQASEMVGPLLQEKKAVLRTEGPFPKVRGDRVRVIQVFANLISNAVKYNESPVPEITVGARTNAGQPTVFFVRDNGIGVPAEQREAIFRIFKRLHGKDEYGGGSGTGLTIAKAIAERHGGNLWFEPGVDGGSTFCFTLERGTELP